MEQEPLFLLVRITTMIIRVNLSVIHGGLYYSASNVCSKKLVGNFLKSKIANILRLFAVAGSNQIRQRQSVPRCVLLTTIRFFTLLALHFWMSSFNSFLPLHGYYSSRPCTVYTRKN